MGIEFITLLSIVGISVLLFFQDLKYRKIDIRLLMLLFIASLVFNYSNPLLTYIDLSIVLGYILLVSIFVVVYYSIKNGGLINPLKEKIGIGDLLYFIAVAPLFYLKNYILFFICGLFFSIIIHSAINRYQSKKTVPLAGYFSAFFILIYLSNQVFNFSFFGLVSDK